MPYAVGDKVKCKYLATSAGVRCPGDWWDGTIKKVNADKTYNVVYDDGDRENAVLERYIKPLCVLEQSCGATATADSASSRRAGKRRAPPAEEADVETAAVASRRAGKRRAPPAPAREPEPMEEEEEEEVVEVPPPHARRAGKQRVPAPPPPEEEEDDVEEVPAAAATASADADGASSADADGNADEEVRIVGHSGALALVDFPHSRENCASHPFVSGKEASRCPNCYCYVCDQPAADCPEWSEHCKATHTSGHWQQQRALWKQYKGKPPADAAGSSGGAAADGGAGASSPSRSLVGRTYVTRWSCDEFLARIQQVYPLEEPEPPGFNGAYTLRPYQRQSLAFMLQIERSNDASLLGQRDRLVQLNSSLARRRYMYSGGETEWKNVSAVNAAMSQQLGFLASPALRPSRGGWLCDEVGMGKTAVVAALILANPAAGVKPVSDAAFANLMTYDGTPHRFKLTVIIVNNTLVQQWTDELRKFAPGLKVCTYYGDGKKKSLGLQQLREMDVLLTTPHMLMPEYMLANMKAHRLVVDEAHLLSGTTTTMSKLGTLSQYQAEYTWLVTGTPFSSSLEQIKNQARLLGQYDDGLMLSEVFHGVLRPGVEWPPKPGTHEYHMYIRGYARPPKDDMSNEQVVDRMRQLMIRHTKAMRIGGEVALALPDADCSTVWLDMSDDERLMYNVHRCIQPTLGGYGGGDYLSRCVSQLNACSHLYSPDVVCGADGSFNAAHADALGLGHRSTYAAQLQALEDLERFLESGYVVRSGNKYKYAPGRGPHRGRDFEQLSKEEQEEKETFDVGEGDATSSKFPRSPPTLSSPFAHGAFVEATAAFLRTHAKQRVPAPKLSQRQRRAVNLGLEPEPPEFVDQWVSTAKLTKFQVLISDLATLRETEPHFRVIVFTRHSLVQERLVKLVESEARPDGCLAPTPLSKLSVFEFNTKTAPQARHRIIQQFQDVKYTGARVLVVTYATAAVGITLTAANRIFLMEPCLDPAEEIQAAGRIHRLGQEKDCFIKRLAFRNSIEEAVIELHDAIKAKKVEVVDGKINSAQAGEVLSAFQKDRTTHDHSGGTRERKGHGHAHANRTPFEEVQGPGANRNHQWSSEKVGAFIVKLGRQKSRAEVWREKEKAYEAANTYEYTCQQAACAFCGLYADVPGSFRWAGTGVYGYLDGDTRGPPMSTPSSHVDAYKHSYHRFAGVPRPPDGWRGLALEQTDNGGELPAEGGGGAGSSSARASRSRSSRSSR